eukprot:gene16295-11651_t
MGRHGFIGLPTGGMGCAYCGQTRELLETRGGADGKLPPCPEGPDELPAQPPSPSAKRRRLESELIHVDTFAKPVSECVNSFNVEFDRHRFVDLDRVADDCLTIVRNQLTLETPHADRVPPLVLMRFARGGKTSTLAKVFDLLKQQCSDIHPIAISFNGNAPAAFRRRVGETQAQSILRLIAAQLGDYTPEQALRLVVDREALDRHLGDHHHNVVLLLDELNNLGAPLDADAAALLREMFLDRAGRFLVFSSHFPVAIEGNDVMASDFLGRAQCAPNPASGRGVSMVNMSLGSTLQELRDMSTACEALTEQKAAWLAYIPSLIYITMNNTGRRSVVTPSTRVAQMNITVDTGSQLDVLQKFVMELRSGRRDPLVARYYGALASVGADLRVSYPLCYVKEILAQLSDDAAVTTLLEILNKLESQLGITHSGLAWECTVQVAIILQMLAAHWFGWVGPFGLVPTGTKPALAFRTLPGECDSLQNARTRMNDMIAAYTVPTLIYVGSANARYPEVEGFVAYTDGRSSSVKIVGFQMKSADVKPRRGINTRLIHGGAVLIRGRARAKRPREPKAGWTYMTSAQVRGFLGNSLLLAMPREWLQDP